MAEIKRVEGYMQPCLIFCPNGHVMLRDGQGDMDALQATCVTEGCEHFHITYKVMLPKVELVEKVKK